MCCKLKDSIKMKDYFEFVDQLDEATTKKMQEGFVIYEKSHGVDVNYKPFAIVLKSAQNEVIGVLNAYTAFAEIYIDDMWVDQAYRGKGYGRKLIEKLEEHFKDKGYNNINLMTSAFQVPDFYKKCGFELEFIRENKINPKFTKFFFVKFFDNQVQTQGLI